MKIFKYSSLSFVILLLTSCGSFVEGMLMGISGYGYNYGYPQTFGSNGNLDYLLDPNYAVAQTVAQQNQYNQIFGSIATQTVNQVYSQEEQEYQEFCKYNKKSDGTNFTKNEWRTMKGKVAQSSHTSNSSTQSKSSSSQSENYTSRTCRKISASDIAHCNGNGLCSKCNGKGRYYDTSLGSSRWVDPCDNCKGSGKCPGCHGTGRR